MKLDAVKHTYVGGLKTACLSRAQLVDVIAQRVSDFCTSEAQRPMLVFDSNGQGISIANSDPQFRDLLAQADIVHADGQSVVSMSRWLTSEPIPERSATTDTIHDIPRLHGPTLKHFLLGGQARVVNQCADILTEQYQNFACVGTADGYFSPEQEAEIVAEINAAQPDVLWVGLGKPKEQAFCIRHRDNLRVPVIITCGGCYNYITGDYARAPLFMQNLGLEWLHRAATEPRKFLWRYMTTNPHAIYCALKHRKYAG